MDGTHTNEDMAQRIQKLVTHIVKEQDIEWKWVKGHDNIVGNERADGLAKCGTEGKYHNAHADNEWMEFTVAAKQTAENSQVEKITTNKFITLCRQSAEEILGRGSPPFSGSPFTMEDRNTAADYKRRLKETWKNIHREQGTGREIPIRTEYHRLNREFRKFKYKAKQEYIRQVCKELEGAMEVHDVGKFYKLLPKLGVQLEGFSRRGLEPHSLQQITTYLTELGSNPPIVTDATIEQGLPQLPSDYTLDMAPHDAEILHELSRMKNSAPGEDEVNSNMYKSLSPLGKRVLCQRLRDLWTSPTHTWSSSLHSTLGFRSHKKGCRHDLGNYRTLWLISVIVRLLCRILASRVSRYCEFHHLLPNTQWGFRANHSTQGPAMLLRCIAEQANAIGTRPENAPDRVAALFLDIEKAYPSVPTDAAERLFLRVGLPPIFVKLLVGVHKNAKYRVRTNEGIGDYFVLQKGFREGDPSSPAAFSLYHSAVMTHVEKKLRMIDGDQCLTFTTSGTDTWMKQRRRRGRPRHAEEHRLQTVMFADDTTLITREPYLREVEKAATETMLDWGEKTNNKKTERIIFGQREDVPQEDEAGEPGIPPLRYQDQSKVVGVIIHKTGRHEADTDHRISTANKVWKKLFRQLPRLSLVPRDLGRVIRATVLASLLYGTETRPVNKKCLQKFNTFFNKVLRGCTATRKSEMHDNQENMYDIMQRMGLDSIETQIQVRRLRWLGRIASMPQGRWEHIALTGALSPEWQHK